MDTRLAETTDAIGAQEPCDAENAASVFCGVEQAARLLGDKWTLVLLRDLGSGARHFSELEASASGISPRTLVSRLRNLERQGLVTRERHRALPPRVVYGLTVKGRDALPVVEALRSYGNRWLCGQAESSTV
jgi:DNA-binding HxlR family transcriptional regulator